MSAPSVIWTCPFNQPNLRAQRGLKTLISSPGIVWLSESYQHSSFCQLLRHSHFCSRTSSSLPLVTMKSFSVNFIRLTKNFFFIFYFIFCLQRIHTVGSSRSVWFKMHDKTPPSLSYQSRSSPPQSHCDTGGQQSRFCGFAFMSR